MNRDRIAELLAGHDPLHLQPGGMQPAAVLVPLRSGSQGPSLRTGTEVILTRRSEYVGDHSGQVAFPGGRIEEEDENAVAAALREAQEELSIPPDQVEVIGFLDEMLTVTGFHVVPVVGWLEGQIELVPDRREVARVFSVPLSDLLQADRWEQQVHRWRGSEVKVWHFPFDGEDIWGATAFMLRGFVELAWRS